MRRTPQSRNSPAKRASCEPLVVSVSSSSAPLLEMARQRAHQRHHVAPDQRFAAGQPQLAHALGDEGRTQPVEFLERQQVGLGQEGHVFRHAIEAAQVAAVGDRYPQIADGPAERIGHRTRQQMRGDRGGSVHSTGLVTAAAAVTTRRGTSQSQCMHHATGYNRSSCVGAVQAISAGAGRLRAAALSRRRRGTAIRGAARALGRLRLLRPHQLSAAASAADRPAAVRRTPGWDRSSVVAGVAKSPGILDDLHRHGGRLELVHRVGDREAGVGRRHADRAGRLAARSDRGAGIGALRGRIRAAPGPSAVAASA